MTTQTKDSGKTFNFYINDWCQYASDFNEGSYLHSYEKDLCVKISENGKELKEFSVGLLYQEGYGMPSFSFVRFGEMIPYKDIQPSKIAKLITSVSKDHKEGDSTTDYDPAKDRISYEYDPSIESKSCRCSLQYSAEALSDIIEEEMKRLIPKNKQQSLDYQI
jgi:hypothetical protein